MILPLFIGLLIAFGCASLWISKSSKRSDHSDDFFLMGRKLGLFGLIMSMLGTQIGGGALLGASEEAYTRGWSVLFYPMGMVLGLAILGLGYGARMRKLNLTTVPEIFEKIYKSPALRQAASLLSIVSLFLILVGQGIAAHKFFISLGFQGDLLFILFWGVLIATTMGGLSAAVKTDILQTLFIIVSLVIALGAVFYTQHPIDSTAATLPILQETTPWLSWLALPLFFMLIEQDMGQWCFAAKNSKTVSIAALISAGVLMAVSLIPICFGALAAKHQIPVAPGSSVLIAAVENLTNPVIATLMICAILMAIISTANAILLSLSSNIVCDFPKLGKSPAVSRSMTAIVGIAALALAFIFDRIVTVLMFSYGLAVCVLFIPITMAVWRKQPHKISAIVSMSIGACAFMLLQLWTVSFPTELICLSLSFLSFEISELVMQKRKITEIRF